MAKNPYKTLGISRKATVDDIKKAFRKYAKQYHPDKTKGDKKAEERFKAINDAYAILGDEAKRKKYDAECASQAKVRGAPKRAAKAKRAPAAGAGSAAGPKRRVQTQARSQAPSEPEKGGFFNKLRAFGMQQGEAETASVKAEPAAGRGMEADMTISMDEALRGCTKSVNLQLKESGAFGRSKTTSKQVGIKVPPGIKDGQRIRLKGQGGGGEDLFLRIRVDSGSVFSFEKGELVTDLRVSPWDAALGERIEAPTLDGVTDLKLPAGVRSGQKLRLKGHGRSQPGQSARGDLFYRVMIDVPKNLTPAEKTLFQQLRDTSRFNPRLRKS